MALIYTKNEDGTVEIKNLLTPEEAVLKLEEINGKLARTQERIAKWQANLEKDKAWEQELLSRIQVLENE